MYMIPYSTRNTRSGSSLMDLFDEFERSVFGENGRRVPAFSTDIRDEGSHYLLEAELPGFDKSDISLDVKEGILTITAKHQEEEEHKEEKGGYIRRERRFGSFSRSFDITGIDEGGITAADVNGILELRLPKAVPVIPEARRIAIE